MSNTINLLNGLEYLYPENQVVSQIKRVLTQFPECEHSLVDAFSLGQLRSKSWLIEHLPNNLGMVFVCAGWYGTLASMMFDRVRHKFSKIRSFDINPACAAIADTMNRPYVMDGWQFKASTLDILAMNYPTEHTTFRANGTSLVLTEAPDTIINTSCEHIENFQDWYSQIPAGKLMVLQTNNYFVIPDHVNCSASLDEFAQNTPMTSMLYQGQLELPDYTRYMRIGFK